MRKKHKHHAAPHLHRRHGRPFNFASGIIYATAVMVSVALGALFYSGYRRAQRSQAAPAGRQQVSPDVPPGARVVTRDGTSVQTYASPSTPAAVPNQTAARPEPDFGAPAEPAATSAAPAQSAGTPASLAVTPATGGMPEINPPLPTPWSAAAVDRTLLQEQKIFPIADTSVFAQPASSREVNGGAAMELPLKGNDSFILTRYNIDKIRGWTVTKAIWHGKVKQGRVASLGFSTIMADWAEGTGTLKGPSPGGATYRWGDAKTKPWCEPDTPITHVIRGNGHALISVGEPDKPDNGPDDWIAVPFDPALVQALVAGSAYGIAITDEKGQRGLPAAIASREDSNSCYFIQVEGGLLDMSPPGRITDFRADAHPALARQHSVGALLAWTAGGDEGNNGQAFRYDVRYAPSPATFDRARELPHSLVPLPQPAGKPEQLVIEGLEPDTTYSFFIRSVDEAGQSSPVVETTLRTPPPLNIPSTADAPTFDATPIDVAAGSLNLRVVDDLSGVDPLSGNVTERLSPVGVGLKVSSPIWDRSSRTLHLRAAQNETIGFAIALHRRAPAFPSVTISAPPFHGTRGAVGGSGLQFRRIWYGYAAPVAPGARPAWRGEALVPIGEHLDLTTPANNVPSQSVQCVYAELHIPSATPAGTYRSELVVTREDGTQSRLNVMLDVLPIRLPDRPRFEIELVVPAPIALLYKKDVSNKDDAAPIEEAHQRVARDNRCTATYLPYLRNGAATEPFAPSVSGDGLDLTIPSWTAWDSRLRSHLSGSALAGSEQGEFPVSHILLPVFENWPTPLESGYICAEKDLLTAAGLKVFGGASEEIYGCLNSDYWRAMRAAVQQFRDHIHSQGWNETAVHVWLNNEPIAPYNGKAPPWFLGKPLYRDDFAALESFAQAVDVETATWAPNRFFFRVHVPDAVALGSYGIRRFSLLAASETDPAAWKLLRDRAAATREELWFQSDALPLDDSMLGIESAALKAFLEGANGWVVRETIGRADSIGRPVPASLFYAGTAIGTEGPVPSLRLKALRRAEQDIEYLLLLQEKMGWSRSQLRDFVYQRIPNLGEPGRFSAQDAYQLRFSVQNLLVQGGNK